MPQISNWQATDLDEFKTFDEPSLIKVRDAALSLLNEMSDPTSSKRWLTLTGISGLGKTYLAKMIRKKYEESIAGPLKDYVFESTIGTGGHVPSFDSAFVKWRDVAERIKAGEWQAAHSYRYPYLLIIDDIGDDESGTKIDKITSQKLYDLIDERMGKWTIITSNKSLKNIADNERRMASRMIRDGNVAIELKGEDYSIRMIKNNKPAA